MTKIPSYLTYKRHRTVMDKELDESLQEIKKLLFLSAWINLLSAKENCGSQENSEELDEIHIILDTLMSNWTFQQEMK